MPVIIMRCRRRYTHRTYIDAIIAKCLVLLARCTIISAPSPSHVSSPLAAILMRRYDSAPMLDKPK